MYISEEEFKKLKRFFGSKKIVKKEICKQSGIHTNPLYEALSRGRMTTKLFDKLKPVISELGYK